MPIDLQPQTKSNCYYYLNDSNSNRNDDSVSSCSDNNSISSSIGSSSSMSSITSNTQPRNIRSPTKSFFSPMASNQNQKSSSPALPSSPPPSSTPDKLSSATTENQHPSSEFPSSTYLRKRRHSADEIMDMPNLPPARRGIVNSGSATPEEPAASPPLAALNFDFDHDSFRRDPTGRVRIEVVPTPSATTDDMELSYQRESAAPPRSPLYQLGEPTEPRHDHPTHPLHPLENELKCSICCELMVAPHGLSCGHTFCGMCLAMWVDGDKKDCPECRANVIHSPRSMFQIYKLDGAIEIIASMIFNERELEERRARKTEWVDYYNERFPQPHFPQPHFIPFLDPNGLRRYSALLRDQYVEVLRGIRETSVESPRIETTSFISSPVAPMIHGPAVRSRPIPIPKGVPRST